ncbi:uncharacterized protein [Nicotiana tomentosiformis]|uniref:uncharacterized protein n=1 Tax=Nicotiana tomentosiformis TaxID=4098 RepID=UPI00388C91A0
MAIGEDSSSSELDGTTVNSDVGVATGGGIMNLDHNHPLYLHPCNGPGSMFVGLLLIGMENYIIWSRAMKMALLGKNKLCLVDGSTCKDDFGVELENQWERCNDIVTSWLMSNVSKELHIGVLFSSNAQTESSSVSVYFTKLKDLWAEYDSILPPPSSKEYVNQLEFQRLLQFLMGLNDSFEQARGQILLIPNVPTIIKHMQ